MNEGELMNIIMDNLEVITCFDCGEKIIESRNRVTDFDRVGIMHLDPGSSNYPREPDEPAGLYFQCMDCFNYDK